MTATARPSADQAERCLRGDGRTGEPVSVFRISMDAILPRASARSMSADTQLMHVRLPNSARADRATAARVGGRRRSPGPACRVPVKWLRKPGEMAGLMTSFFCPVTLAAWHGLQPGRDEEAPSVAAQMPAHGGWSRTRARSFALLAAGTAGLRGLAIANTAAAQPHPVKHIIQRCLANPTFQQLLGYWCNHNQGPCPHVRMPASVSLSHNSAV